MHRRWNLWNHDLFDITACQWTGWNHLQLLICGWRLVLRQRQLKEHALAFSNCFQTNSFPTTLLDQPFCSFLSQIAHYVEKRASHDDCSSQCTLFYIFQKLDADLDLSSQTCLISHSCFGTKNNIYQDLSFYFVSVLCRLRLAPSGKVVGGHHIDYQCNSAPLLSIIDPTLQI